MPSPAPRPSSTTTSSTSCGRRTATAVGVFGPAAGQAADRDYAWQFLATGAGRRVAGLEPAGGATGRAGAGQIGRVPRLDAQQRALSLERAGAEQPGHRRRGPCRPRAGGIRRAGVSARRRPRAGPRSEAARAAKPVVTAAGGQAGACHAIERARRLREFARFWELSQAASPGRQPGDKAASSQGGGDLNTDAPGSRTHQFAPGDSR